MTLGEKLKELRIKYGYTQDELSKRLGVTRQAVTKWENNRGLPDKASLNAIQKIFNVSMDSLIDNDLEITFLKKKIR